MLLPSIPQIRCELATCTVGNGAHPLQSLIGTGYNEPLRPLVTGVSCDSNRSGNQIYNPAAFTLIGYQIGTIPSNLEPRGYCPGPATDQH